MKLRLFSVLALLAVPLLLMGTITAHTHRIMMNTITTSGTTTRVSVASDGTQGNEHSFSGYISADGRYVTFSSWASNLVPGDTNGDIYVYAGDVFIHDRETGQLSRVSVASDGTQANGSSGGGSISADGRYVAFSSDASNLVPGDANDAGDVFIHDRQTGQTSRVSVASDGTQANGSSGGGSISADGRYVAFSSDATNLVPGDINAAGDIFFHDRQTGQTSRVSVASDGTQGNGSSYAHSISADGRYVAFSSDATNLVPGDTNVERDIFIHDRQTGQTSRVSVASDGTQGNGGSFAQSISADGRYVAFLSGASNLVPGDINDAADVFVRDRQTGQTSRVSVASDGTQGNGGTHAQSISADGRYVGFTSAADNMVPGDTNFGDDVFIHDRQTGQTNRISVASDGTQASNSSAGEPSMSADGRYAIFSSGANNLVPGDTNSNLEVFVHERQAETSITVTPDEGSTLIYTDTQGLTTTVIFPAGAVTGEAFLVYSPVDQVTPPSGLQFTGHAFELTAYQGGVAQVGFTFSQPVNVVLTYSDEETAGMVEDMLTLQVWDGPNWVDAAETCSPASTYIRDTANNTLSVDICHLSQFALLGPEGHSMSIYLPLVVSSP